MSELDGGGMGDPDWGRYMVQGPQIAPLGDATRWGAQVVTPLVNSRSIFSEQIIVAGTRDAYSRNWAVIGTVTMPLLSWAAPSVWGGLLSFVVTLEVVMGVGQMQVVHRIVLAAGSQPTIGLCNQQYAGNGGPYASTPETAPGGTTDDSETRAFAAIGSLVGQSISIRALYFTGSAANCPGLPTNAKLSLLVTPFAAGTGL